MADYVVKTKNGSSTDSDMKFIAYNDMDYEQKDMVYYIMSYDDRFTEDLAVSALNSTGFDQDEGRFVCLLPLELNEILV